MLNIWVNYPGVVLLLLLLLLQLPSSTEYCCLHPAYSIFFGFDVSCGFVLGRLVLMYTPLLSLVSDHDLRFVLSPDRGPGVFVH